MASIISDLCSLLLRSYSYRSVAYLPYLPAYAINSNTYRHNLPAWLSSLNSLSI